MSHTDQVGPTTATSPPYPVNVRPSRRALRLRFCGPAVLVLALGAYVAEFARWHGFLTQIDLMVYRYGGHRVLSGLDLYSRGIFNSPRILLFTYTPFAALCFTPLNLLTVPWLRVLSLVGAVLLLTYAVHRMLTALHARPRRGWWALTALLVGLCLWLEPVRYSVQLGQINLLILAVVVADLLGAPERKWAGVGIGTMAGIKLTPVIFLIYLALIGRRRAALIGTTTLAATVALGFAVLPRDSASYWFGGKFTDPQRIDLTRPDAQQQRARAVSPTALSRRARHHRRNRGRGGVPGCGRYRLAPWATRPRLEPGRTGRSRSVAVQLEPPLGVVRPVDRSSRLSLVRPGVEDCGLGDVADVGGDRGMADLAARQNPGLGSGGVARRWPVEQPAAQWLRVRSGGRGYRVGGVAVAHLATRGRARRSSGGLAGDESGNSPSTTHHRFDRSESIMIVLGVILLLIGYFTGLSLLYTIGGILVVVGVVLWLLGAVGRPIGGRKVWY